MVLFSEMPRESFRGGEKVGVHEAVGPWAELRSIALLLGYHLMRDGTHQQASTMP